MLVQQGRPTAQVIAPKTRLAQGIATARLSFDALPLKRYPHRTATTFSPQWCPDRIAAQVKKLKPDLINLHWVNEGFLRLETLAKLPQPLVWTLHDMWPLTGGCHYSGDCRGYEQSCGACPQLGSQNQSDLSHQIWQRKRRAWNAANLTLVALCDWMAEAARASALFSNARIERIPNGIDTETFQPLEPEMARRLLRLPPDRPLILFGALNATQDRRKGFHLLQPALQALCQRMGHAELVVFGAERPASPPDFGLPCHYLGSFQDDLSLALLYSAVDLFVLPSTEENLANTILEALACGTPCVAFGIGGMPDLIEHQQNGYLAKPGDTKDLAQGMCWVLEQQSRSPNLAQRAREKVIQEFTLEIQSRRYLNLFADILSDSSG
jgi:glycosyltransferase involved in cell wall biosynthesis